MPTKRNVAQTILQAPPTGDQHAPPTLRGEVCATKKTTATVRLFESLAAAPGCNTPGAIGEAPVTFGGPGCVPFSVPVPPDPFTRAASPVVPRARRGRQRASAHESWLVLHQSRP